MIKYFEMLIGLYPDKETWTFVCLKCVFVHDSRETRSVNLSEISYDIFSEYVLEKQLTTSVGIFLPSWNKTVLDGSHVFRSM